MIAIIWRAQILGYVIGQVRIGASPIMSMSLSWKAILSVVLLAAAGQQAFAQMSSAQPYAGLQERAIKSLSREQIAQLSAGEGMGLALAAELNGYPGPRHVLDLGSQLDLTDEERTQIQHLFDAMKAEAVPVGQRLIAAERDLNRAFADRTITPERLQAATASIGELQGQLRNTHLKYHLATAALLSPDQIHRYVELRGYTAVANAAHAPLGPQDTVGGAVHHNMMGPMHGE
jgi:Spy/CpxP family protein refolding chaperone